MPRNEPTRTIIRSVNAVCLNYLGLRKASEFFSGARSNGGIGGDGLVSSMNRFLSDAMIQNTKSTAAVAPASLPFDAEHEMRQSGLDIRTFAAAKSAIEHLNRLSVEIGFAPPNSPAYTALSSGLFGLSEECDDRAKNARRVFPTVTWVLRDLGVKVRKELESAPDAARDFMSKVADSIDGALAHACGLIENERLEAPTEVDMLATFNRPFAVKIPRNAPFFTIDTSLKIGILNTALSAFSSGLKAVEKAVIADLTADLVTPTMSPSLRMSQAEAAFNFLREGASPPYVTIERNGTIDISSLFPRYLMPYFEIFTTEFKAAAAKLDAVFRTSPSLGGNSLTADCKLGRLSGLFGVVPRITFKLPVRNERSNADGTNLNSAPWRLPRSTEFVRRTTTSETDNCAYRVKVANAQLGTSEGRAVIREVLSMTDRVARAIDTPTSIHIVPGSFDEFGRPQFDTSGIIVHAEKRSGESEFPTQTSVTPLFGNRRRFNLTIPNIACVRDEKHLSALIRVLSRLDGMDTPRTSVDWCSGPNSLLMQLDELLAKLPESNPRESLIAVLASDAKRAGTLHAMVTNRAETIVAAIHPS